MTPFVLVSGDFVTTGGMDRANYALAAYLARRGRAVHLVTHRAARDLQAMPGVTTHRVPKLAGSYFLSEPLLDLAGRWAAGRYGQAGARVLVNGGNCCWSDINWIHYVHAAYEPATAARGLRLLKHRWGRQRALRRERSIVPGARVVIANSARTRQHLIQHLGVPEKRIQVVYYGTDPETFRPATEQERRILRQEVGLTDDRLRVAFLGALGDRRKGFDTVYAAWKRLCSRPDWTAELVVIGAGSELPLWRARAEAEGLAGSTRFLGFCQNVSGFLRVCDALVAPTRYEAYGLGVQEALCCALPVFVSAEAGVAERYPPELQDWLLPHADCADELVERLRAWQSAPNRHRAIQLDFAAELARRTWDDMAAQVVSLIERNCPG